MLKLLFGFLLMCGAAFAQCGANGTLIINPITGLPDCTGLPGAGTGTVTSVGLLGTANQVTVTGTSPITGAGSFTLSVPSTFTFPGTVTNNLSIFGATTSAQFAGVISDESGTGLVILQTSPTIVTPTIASFTNATHGHTNAAGGGQLTPSTALSATGTPSSTTFLRGDNSWATPSGSGTVTSIATTSPITGGTITTTGTIACATCVTSAASLTSTAIMTGAGSQASQTPAAAATLDSSGNISTPGTVASGVGGSVAGAIDMGAGTAPAVGSSVFGWGAPTTMTTSVRLVSPNAVPGANQVMLFAAPSSNIATWTWTGVSGTGSFCMTTSCTMVTPTLGAATATSINGLTITSSTGTFTLTNAKTLSVSNSLTLAGTDSTTMTFPSTSQTIPGMNQTNTGGASLTWDMNASTGSNALRVPVKASVTTTSNGAIGYDSTTNMLHAAQSSADASIPQFTITPAADSNCVKWVVSGSNYKLGDAGAACGSGSGGTAGQPFFSTTASTTVTATSATTLIGSVSGSTTIPANTFAAGGIMEFIGEGYYSTPATATSLTIDLKIGGTTRITTGSALTLASTTNGVWRLHCTVTTRTAGSSGTQIANCIFEMTGATLTPGELPLQTSSTWTVDTTGTLAIDLQATWSTATGSPTITATNVAAWSPGGITNVTFTGGIISVANGSTAPALTPAGTSGGIPYFSGATTWASSAALTAHGVVVGGGAATAPTSTSAGTSGQVLTSNGSGSDPTFQKTIRGVGFSIGDVSGSTLTTSSVSPFVTVPFACTISAYNLDIDAGTITVKFWKVATGTAVPTSSNSISTSGVAISSGTAIHSTTTSDFTSTAVAANDIMAMAVTAVSTAKTVTGVLQCDIP